MILSKQPASPSIKIMIVNRIHPGVTAELSMIYKTSFSIFHEFFITQLYIILKLLQNFEILMIVISRLYSIVYSFNFFLAVAIPYSCFKNCNHLWYCLF